MSRYIYNVTDDDELNEWFQNKRDAIASCIHWFETQGIDHVRVDRHELDRLTQAYVCKLLTGCGWSLGLETVFERRREP
jgi:LPS sulfotransferase NodH